MSINQIRKQYEENIKKYIWLAIIIMQKSINFLGQFYRNISKYSIYKQEDVYEYFLEKRRS